MKTILYIISECALAKGQQTAWEIPTLYWGQVLSFYLFEALLVLLVPKSRLQSTPQYCRSGLAKTVVKGVMHSQQKHIRDLKINGSIGGEAFNGEEVFWGTTVLQRCLEQPVSDYFWKPDFCENNLLLVFSTTYLILIQEYTEDTVTKEEWWGSVPVSLQVHQQSSLLYIYSLSPWCPRYALSQTSFKNPLF